MDVLDGRYRLIRRLGGGGMAAVWLAHDERLDREVAVKLLSDVLVEDEDYRRRFEREAQVAAGLHHPNLIAVFDYSATAERPYLVMELVRGGTLGERIPSGRTRELDLTELARELLSALDAIHAAGVVHRDVKPANVVLDVDGRARLTDFGIARPGDATSLTRTGNVIGTLKFMAPEVKRGEPATPRSDLYSLGLLLRESGGEIDADLAALIAALTAEDPLSRPGSATAALDLLETAPTAPLAAGVPLAGRTAARVGAGLAVVAVAALILVLVAGGGDDEGGSPAPSRETTQRAAGAAAAKTRTTTTTVEAAPTTTATETTPTTTTAATCDALEEQKKALDEERKAAEEAVKDDPEAKKAVHDRYETQKQTLEEEIKACKEAQH